VLLPSQYHLNAYIKAYEVGELEERIAILEDAQIEK